MYTSTSIPDASARARALSQALDAVIRERRAQDPGLGIPDTLVALELAKASLLQESGITVSTRRLVVTVMVLAAAVTGVALFILSR